MSNNIFKALPIIYFFKKLYMKNFHLLLQVYLRDFYLPHLILILNPIGLAHVMHPIFQPRVSPPVTATANVFCQDLPYL